MYDILVFVHVLAAVIWVGGGFALNVVGTRIVKAANSAATASFAHQAAFIGQRIFAPTSLILLAAGVAMTLDRWSFRQLWIAIGVAGFLYSFITGAFIIGPLSGKTGKLLEERGAEDAQVLANIRKLFLFGRIELAVMIVVIAAMTLKPGLG